MTESMKYYESIRRKYPETVSKDQFYQIAHISKATALHLLQNGLVPCKDTGKKTRRYTIRTDDIIFYLIDRELHPEVYRAPDRWYQERSGHYNSLKWLRQSATAILLFIAGATPRSSNTFLERIPFDNSSAARFVYVMQRILSFGLSMIHLCTIDFISVVFPLPAGAFTK